MTRKSNAAITQSEVSTALAQFLKHGGVIQKLPAQTFRPAGTVGGEKYDAYESLSDLPTLAGSGEQRS